MKTCLFFTALLLGSFTASAQDQINTFITEAQEFLAQKNYKQAQLSLQDAINEIEHMLGGQVADALPDEINGLTSSGDASANNGVMGMYGGGSQISRSYVNSGKPENTAEINILANSPMLTAVNMYITNPAMLGDGYKSVRVGTKRAVLKSEMQDYYGDNGGSKSVRSTEIQLPLNQTLITFNLMGFASEQDELAFAAKLDYDKIRTLLGE